MGLESSYPFYKDMMIPVEKISKEEYGPDCTVSNTKFSSVTLNELAMKAKEKILQFRVSTRCKT